MVVLTMRRSLLLVDWSWSMGLTRGGACFRPGIVLVTLADGWNLLGG